LIESKETKAVKPLVTIKCKLPVTQHTVNEVKSSFLNNTELEEI